MERVYQLISGYLKRQYDLPLSRVFSKLRSDLLADMEQVACNLCGRDSAVEIAHRDKYDLPLTSVMCRNCGLMYLNPRPSRRGYDRFYLGGGDKNGVYHISASLAELEPFLQRYYGPEFRMRDADVVSLHDFAREKFLQHFGQVPDAAGPELVRDLEAKAKAFESAQYDTYANHIYEYFQAFVPRGGKVFEIGAAWGKLLLPWRDRHGCDISGLEPRARTVQAAKDRLGIVLHQGFPATAAVPENTYDAVLIIRTINHMVDPLGDLRHAWRWLKPGGVLLIDIADAVREAHYEGFESNVVEIDQPYMFTANTLSAFIQQAGFETVQCQLVDTRHVFWGDRREPEDKQIRLIGRKSLAPVTVQWPNPVDELSALVRAQLAHEAALLQRLDLQKRQAAGKKKARKDRAAHRMKAPGDLQPV